MKLKSSYYGSQKPATAEIETANFETGTQSYDLVEQRSKEFRLYRITTFLVIPLEGANTFDYLSSDYFFLATTTN